METPVIISKESISAFKFTKTEVLETFSEIVERREKLDKATLLGNAFHNKVKIVFNTKEGIKEVETTIWASTDKNIILKGGISIPIVCIYDIIID